MFESNPRNRSVGEDELESLLTLVPGMMVSSRTSRRREYMYRIRKSPPIVERNRFEGRMDIAAARQTLPKASNEQRAANLSEAGPGDTALRFRSARGDHER